MPSLRTNIIDVSHMSGIRYFSGAAQDGEDVLVVDQYVLSGHNEKRYKYKQISLQAQICF